MWLKLYTNSMKHKYKIIACLVIIAYVLPYYILGEDTHIRVHDNMDSNIVWYKLLVESGHIFSLKDVALPNVIDGLPRSTLASSLDAMVWMYALFEPMTAYAIGQTVMRFVAFFGMYLLLNRHILRNQKLPFITVGIALCFALLPYWPSGMLSIAGLPLALHVFLTFRKYGKETPKYNWIILGLIPFLSNFVLTFVFFLTIMGFLWLFDWIRTKKSNWVFFISIAFMTFIYLVQNYLLIYSMFFNKGFTSHRDELDLGHKDIPGTFDLFLHNFFYGHTHDLAEQLNIVIPVIGVALIVAAFRNLKPKLLLGLFLSTVVLSLWYAFWYWEGWRVLKDQFMVLNTFNFSRFHFLTPLIWYLCFALALVILWRHLKLGKLIVVILLIMQCVNLFNLNEESKYSEAGTPTFKEFYAEALFDDIKDYIGEDLSEYRVVSIGMHPTVAQYNGLYTLDTYNNSFPLSYKHQFREVIAPELKKSPSLENYFDTWGGRLYMYVAQLGESYMFSKNSDETIEQLDINTGALRALGDDYILSALPIDNYETLGLKFEKSFEKKGYPWKIYLYKLGE